MHPLLSLSYWFSLRPIPFAPWAERLLLVVFSLFFIAGLVVWAFQMYGKHRKPIRRALGRVATHLGWTGIVGLLLWVVAYEGVPILSMRVFYLLWLVWVITGAVFIARYVWVDVPAMEARQREREEREKWLPKRA